MDSLASHVRRLIPASRGRGRLPAATDRAPIPAGQGVGERAVSQPAESTSNGLVGPFIFVSKTTRIETVTSNGTDIDVEVATSVTWTDADGVEFTLPMEAPA